MKKTKTKEAKLLTRIKRQAREYFVKDKFTIMDQFEWEDIIDFSQDLKIEKITSFRLYEEYDDFGNSDMFAITSFNTSLGLITITFDNNPFRKTDFSIKDLLIILVKLELKCQKVRKLFNKGLNNYGKD